MRRILIVAGVLLLGACATQRHTPAPAPQPPPTVAVSPPAEPAPVKKAKPHPKPAAPAPVAAKPATDALAPEEVGYYMDVMQGRLKQTTGNSVGLVRNGNRIVITATAQLDASTGKPELDVAHSRPFAGIAKVLMEYRKTRLAIRATNVDGSAPPDPAAKAICEQALLHYFEGAGVAADQLSASGARGESSAAKSAYFELDIEPLLRDSPAASR
jgi:hypothetical protein